MRVEHEHAPCGRARHEELAPVGFGPEGQLAPRVGLVEPHHHVERVVASGHQVFERVLVGRAEVDRLESGRRGPAVGQHHLVLAGDGEARTGIPHAERAAVRRVHAGVQGILQHEQIAVIGLESGMTLPLAIDPEPMDLSLEEDAPLVGCSREKQRTRRVCSSRDARAAGPRLAYLAQPLKVWVAWKASEIWDAAACCRNEL